MRRLGPLLILSALFFSYGGASGQSCRPAVLDYIVRDAKGRNLSEVELHAVVRKMPRPAQGVETVAFAADGTLVGYSAKETSSKLFAIYYADAASCHIKVGEITLTNAGRTMRLIFDLDIDRRTYVIDSLPFQTGTFRLDQTGLSDANSDRVIPAAKWKKVGRKP
jgi:hypothetical protein